MPNITVNDDLTSHTVSEDGTKEFFLASHNPLTLKPFTSAEEVEAFAESFAVSHPHAYTPFVSAEEREQQLAEVLASSNRSKRNKLLADSDWTQMPDTALTDEAKTAWATYRTALRDITNHANWPNLEEADWPVKPE